MKFVQRDPGAATENSSGGGTDGFLKEVLYMLLAYGGMIASFVIAVIVASLVLVYCFA